MLLGFVLIWLGLVLNPAQPFWLRGWAGLFSVVVTAWVFSQPVRKRTE